MKRRSILAVLLLVLGPAPNLFAKQPQPVDVGATPNWEDYKRIGTAALKNALIDPDSAKIEWPYVAISGSLKSFLSKSVTGFFTCGLVNARNRMGGYSGRSFFLIMIKDGVVQELEIGGVDTIDTATVSCPAFIKKGMFPIAAAPAPRAQDPPDTQPATGISTQNSNQQR